MIHGLANGVFLDDKRFWPIYERAEKLDVPIYLHPSLPRRAGDATSITRTTSRNSRCWCAPAWGYTVETRPPRSAWCCRGVFDKHPNLKIILGHLGETLPFLVWRIDQALARPGASRSSSFRDVFCRTLLDHDQRQFLQSGVAVLRAWSWASTDSVRGLEVL